MEEASESPAEFDYAQHRKELFLRLADELDRVEGLMPIKLLPDDIEYPQWVKNVEREFSLVMFPAAKLRNSKNELTSKRMGAMLGHLSEIAVWMMEAFNQNTQQIQMSEDDYKKAQKFRADFEDWYKSCRRLAKRSLCSCVDLNYQDMTDFLLGYADAFSRKPKTYKTGNLGSTTFEIYNCMLVYWRFVDQMQSVRQFHEWLVKIFGAQKIGDQKRTEKICQRMGLHFRKRGRPKEK